MVDSKKDPDKNSYNASANTSTVKSYENMDVVGESNESNESYESNDGLVVNPTICPRCSTGFFCNAADIEHCQCWGVKLGMAEFEYLQQQGFSVNEVGCLCRNCLLEIKEKLNKETAN